MGSDEDPTGLLTAKQRNYLTGQSDIEENTSAERNIRGRIRRRIRHGISDFTLVANNLRDRDEKTIADEVRRSKEEGGELYHGIPWTIAFAARLAHSAGDDYDEIVEDGIHRADPGIFDVESNLNITHVPEMDGEAVREKIYRGEPPSPRELGWAWLNGHIDEDELRRAKELPLAPPDL